MKTVTDPEILQSLVARLEALRPDSSRRWGTMTAGEMVCHLGDSASSVLDRPGGPPGRRRPLYKWIALYAPLKWPHGVKTLPQVDPKAGGTRPSNFESDRRRAIDTLRRLAAAPAEALPSAHFVFGAMTIADWRSWAYRHTDHHLRQFGL